jgi:phage-related protein
MGLIKMYFKVAWDFIVGIFSIALDLITGHWGQAWTDCKTMCVQIWNAIWTFLSGSWDDIKQLAIQTFDNILQFLSTTWRATKNEAVTDWNAIRAFLIGLYRDCYNDVVQAFGTIVTWFKGVPGRIIAALGNLGSLLLGAGEAIIGGLISGIKVAMGKLGSVVSGIAGFISGLKGPLPKDRILLIPHGQAIMAGLISGITSQQAALASVVTGIAQSIPDTVSTLLRIASPSLTMADIGLQIGQGLIAGLEGTASQVSSAAAKLATDIEDAFELGDISQGTASSLTAWMEKDNAKLQSLATQRATLEATIATADKYAASVTSSALSFVGVGNLTSDQTDTSAGIAGGLAANLQQLTQFSSDLKKLGKLHLNATTLGQIISAGPVAGDQMAQALISGPLSYINSINSTMSQVNSVATQLGYSAANAMYDTGKNAGKGFLSGLESSLSSLNDAMSKMAKNMIATIKRELKISSPSQVMAEVGGNIALGLVQGIEGGKGRVSVAMAGLAGSLSGSSAGTAGGAAGGTTINVSVSVPAGFIGSEQQLSQALFLVMQKVVLQNARRNTTNGLSLSLR